MADAYQPLNISTGSAQSAIAATPNVTPALNDLMSSIKEGFISVDDVRKRISDGPLEAATRSQNLADVQQVRPLAREASVAQLQNVQAKEKFEAESLPILNDTKRESLKQEYQNVLQHGVPDAVLKAFNSTVPGFIPYDNAKLFPKTGGVDTAYALELMGKAFEKAEKLKLQAKFTGPVKQTTTGPTGAVSETTTVMNQITGQPVGAPIVTETKAAQVGTNTKEIKSSRLSADGKTEEETVQRYDTNTGQLIGEASVIGSKPVKLTQEQANALQFSDRMGFNNTLVADLSTKGFDPAALKTTVQGYLPNRFQPEALQSYTAAKNNWITAALRKESGAAISPSEYMQANKEYFPRDGDSPGIVKQKEALRALAEEDIRMNTPMGGFWNPGGKARQAASPVTPHTLSSAEVMDAVTGVTSAVYESIAKHKGTPRVPTGPRGVWEAAQPPQAEPNIPTVRTPQEAAALPPTVQFFRTPQNQLKVNPNWGGQ